MSSTEIAVHIDNVSKNFKLPHEKSSTLKSTLVNFWRRDKGYETQHVLEDISFDIYKGEFFGIVGRNGSGKSTLLKLIAEIYSTSKGSITINGKLTPFIELGVGFNPELTGRENVYLNGALLGFNHKEVDAMYNDIVDFAEIPKFMDQKLKNYSSGMQVRLAFSIAIRANSDILLIDEVLAVGDLPFQQKCFETFKDIKRSGKTVIFVSHDLGAVESFCDRAVVINNGKMRGIGQTREMIHKYGSILADEEQIKQEAEQKKKESDRKKVLHTGTGDLLITKAELLNAKGEVTKSLDEGEAFTIRTHYLAKKDIPNPTLGIGVMDKEDNSILGPNTKEAKFSIGALNGEGYIDAKFASNVLAPGTYSVRAAMSDYDGRTPYDFAENLMRFKVVGDQRFGKVYLEPTWKVKK
ncbi:MAG TPA: ABC transporter ATP-binding protein [Candidatus Saccharimonadales bacterium]